MSFAIGAVTLPTGPKQVSKRNSAKIEEFEIDSDTPGIIVPGLGAAELNISGFLVGAKSTLENTYLLPLEALVGTVVTVAFPDTRYDGSWVLADFSYSEINAKQFTYSLKLVKGSFSVVL